MIHETPPRRQRRTHSNSEGKIQAACVQWLWNTRPETRGLYIHIPNEGNRRSKIDGSIRKSLGIVAGAPDTFLFIPSQRYHGLAIEFKTDTGVQSEAQKDFQVRLEVNGYKYVIIRSLCEFKEVITDYLD